jgi:oxygen-independent coproporphyrinogen-3 oxidase
VSGIADYIDLLDAGRLPTGTRRALSTDERLTDTMFLGLRLSDGIDIAAVERRYGVDVWSRWGPELVPFIESGLLVREPGRLRLTQDGMLLASEVMQVFV